LKSICLVVGFSTIVFAEAVPLPADPDIQHIIQIPAGGLKPFLKWQNARIPMVSHHRGGPAPGFPENAIETMDNALKYGPGIMEVDVAQLADGILILMHDETIDRTTTGAGKAEALTLADIETLFLVDINGQTTPFRIPKLEQVLKWAVGKTILTLDIKPSVDFSAVAKLVDMTGAQDYVVAITYSLDQALEFHTAAPDMPITVTIRNSNDITALAASGIPSDKIMAWTGTKRLPSSLYEALHGKGWHVIMGTLGKSPNAIDNQIASNDNNERYLKIFKSGVDIIATDRFWAVQQQIRNPNLYFFTNKRTSAAH